MFIQKRRSEIIIDNQKQGFECKKCGENETRKFKNGKIISYACRACWLRNQRIVNARVRAKAEHNILYKQKLLGKRGAVAGYNTELDKILIPLIYLEAQLLTKKTGIPHHVDHIIPLNNKEVSGLHNIYNLRIIKAEENFKKSNKRYRELEELNGIFSISMLIKNAMEFYKIGQNGRI